MATAKLILRTSKPHPVEDVIFYPIWLRLANGDRTKFYATGYYCREEDWNPDDGEIVSRQGFRPRILHKDSRSAMETSVAKKALTDLIDRAKGITEKYRKSELSFTTFEKELYKDKPQDMATDNPITFLDYANAKIQESISSGKYKTASIMDNAVRSLQRCDADFSKRTLADITSKYIKGYIDACKARGNKENTIRISLAQIRKVLKSAIADKLMSFDTYPFIAPGDSDRAKESKISIDSFSVSKEHQNKFLSVEEFRRFATYDFSHDDKKAIAQKLFCASVCLWGMNWKDMAQLTNRNIEIDIEKDAITGETTRHEVIRYCRSKTRTTKKSDNVISIPVNDTIQGLLDWFRPYCHEDYLFPIIEKPISEKTFVELASEKGLSNEDIDAERANHRSGSKQAVSAKQKAKNKVTFGKVAEIYKKTIPADRLEIVLDGIRKRFNKTLDAIAVDLNFSDDTRMQLSAYAARHTFAMQLLTQGVRRDMIQHKLGHRDMKTTENYVKSFSYKDIEEQGIISLK